VTIIASMLLSVVVALILTPVLCASLLNPVPKGHEPAEGGSGSCGPSSVGLTGSFSGPGSLHATGGALSFQGIRYLVVFLLIVGALGFLFRRMPTAYLPDEDQGTLLVQVLLPPNSTMSRPMRCWLGSGTTFSIMKKKPYYPA